MNVVGLVALAGCAAHGLTLSQAKQLALAAPNIENAVRLNHANDAIRSKRVLSSGSSIVVDASTSIRQLLVNQVDMYSTIKRRICNPDFEI